MDKKASGRTIELTTTILSALKKMDALGVKSLMVTDTLGNFEGILSIGDIQRAIINNTELCIPIKSILRTNPKFARPDQTIDEIKEQMLRYRMEFMPVISLSGEIKDVFFWEDLFLDNEDIPYTQFHLPVVIMAGGLGARLRPLTSVFPKPLMPFNERTIIEEIMSRFARHNCTNFYISVNYKSDLIQYYLNHQGLIYNIEFIQESKPLGTGGSLSLLKGRIASTFFVTNCDIIIDQDYSEILNYHQENRNDITIIAALKHYPIPYGVLETGTNGDLKRLQEKPEITFKINSGMYVLESKVLDQIPVNTVFDITQLIEKIKSLGWRVGVFPVSEKSWKDIGTWEEYKRQLF